MKKMIVLSLMISSIAFATEAKKVEAKAATPAVATTTEVKAETKANPCEGLKEKELAACEAKAKTHGKEAKAHAKNEAVNAPAKK